MPFSLDFAALALHRKKLGLTILDVMNVDLADAQATEMSLLRIPKFDGGHQEEFAALNAVFAQQVRRVVDLGVEPGGF